MGLFDSMTKALGLGPKEPDAKAHEMVKQGAILLDVRTKGEFSGGHIKGAINIPVQELGARKKELAKKGSKKIVVYCASGMRSASAASMLSGYDVYNLGPMGAWGVSEDIVR